MEGSDGRLVARRKSRLVLAEELHRLSLDSKRKPSLVFDLGREVADADDCTFNRRRDLTNWLQSNQPSKVRTADTLAVFSSKRNGQEVGNFSDRVALYTSAYEAWTKLLAAESTKTFESLRQLATDQG
jgi:hypothetical protein